MKLAKAVILFFVFILVNTSLQSEGTINWRTYFGGSDEDVITGMDELYGNIYVTGYTKSANTFYSGTYAKQYFGGYDAFVAKFDKNGSLIWSTYFGSTGDDKATSISVDRITHRIVIGGKTTSNEYISTNGAHQSMYGGSEDGFIAVFDDNGMRLWSTYFGGLGNDIVSSVYVSNDSKIAFCGSTTSGNNIAFGDDNCDKTLDGASDAFAGFFEPDGTLGWSTYYGGSGTDSAMGVVMVDKEIIIAGKTSSTSKISFSLPINYFKGGASDAFIAGFESNGKVDWGHYFGGSDDDEALSIGAYYNEGIFICGRTKSTDNISYGNVLKTKLSGGWDGFVAKYGIEGSPDWSGYFGGEGDDAIISAKTDYSGNYVCAGYTNSKTGISYMNPIQGSKGGGMDGFLFQVTESGAMMYSTYFGGSANDYANAAIFKTDGTIYFGGYTDNYDKDFPTYSCFQGTFGGITDCFISKCDAQDISFTGIQSPYCAGDSASVNFKATGSFPAGSYLALELSDSAGNFINADTLIQFSFLSTGTLKFKFPDFLPYSLNYRIRISSNYGFSSTDNGFGILIYSNPVSKIYGIQRICDTSMVYYYNTDFVKMLDYKWRVKHGKIIGTNYKDTVAIKWDEEEDAELELETENGNCSSISKFPISVNDFHKDSIKIPINICAGTPADFTTYNNHEEYSWILPDASTVSDTSQKTVSAVWNDPGLYSIRLVYGNGVCSDTLERSFVVNAEPKTVIHGADSACYLSEPFTYYASHNNGSGVSWTVIGGNFIGNDIGDTIKVNWYSTDSGKISCFGTNGVCSDSTSLIVKILAPPTSNILGPDAICANSTVQYSTEYDTPKSCIWTAVNGTIISPDGQKDVTVQWGPEAKSAKLQLELTNGLCTVSSEKEIALVDQNSLDISGFKVSCPDCQDEYTVPYYRNAIYQWNVTGGDIVSTVNFNKIRVKWNGNEIGTITLKVTLQGSDCSFDKQLSVSVPNGNAIYGTDTVCKQNRYLYRSSVNSGKILNWYAYDGNLIPAANKNEIYVEWNKPGNNKLICEFKADDSEIDSLVMNVFVEDSPDITLNLKQSLCINDNTIQLNFAEPTGGTYYIDGSENNELNPLEFGVGNHILAYLYKTSSQCDVLKEINFTISPLPDIPTLSYTAPDLIVSSNLSEFEWYHDGQPVIGESGRILTPDQSGDYAVKAKNESGCESDLSNTVHIDLSDAPHISCSPEIKLTDSYCKSPGTGLLSIKNSGIGKLELKKIEFGNSEPGFILNYDKSKKYLNSGESINVELQYSPLMVGLAAGELLISTDDNLVPVRTTKILTNAFIPEIISLTDKIQKSGLEINKKNLDTITIRNVGNYSTDIKSAIDNPNIKIISPEQNISAGGGQNIIIACTPHDSSSISGILSITDDCGKLTSIPVTYGIKPVPEYTVVVSSASANSGDTVRINILLPNANAMAAAGITNYHAEFQSNASVLFPVNPDQKGVLLGDLRSIAIDINPAKENSKSLVFIATLGNDSVSTLQIANSSDNLGYSNYISVKGEFTLNDLCTSGGTRLITTAGSIKFSVSPNPASEKLLIETKLIENGYTTLKIYNSFGEVVETIADGFWNKGEYQLPVDLRALGSGKYFVVLITPTLMKSTSLEIIK